MCFCLTDLHEGQPFFGVIFMKGSLPSGSSGLAQDFTYWNKLKKKRKKENQNWGGCWAERKENIITVGSLKTKRKIYSPAVWERLYGKGYGAMPRMGPERREGG